MSFRKILLLFLVNTLVWSFMLAIFEIHLESACGWAQCLPKPWSEPLPIVQLWADISYHPFLTHYHVALMAGFGILLYLEFLLLWGMNAIKMETFWYYRRCGQRFMPFALLAAVWLATLVVEDFFWFCLNWHYPGSLHDLLTGQIWWVTKWAAVGSVMLPKGYLTVWPWVLGLLLLARPHPFRWR